MDQNKLRTYFNKTNGALIASRVRVADSFLSRLVGLLRTPVLPEGEGLLISPCSQIHMIGMKYAIDVIFLDKNDIVVGLCKAIQPGQISKEFKSACACIELPAGTIDATNTACGDTVQTE